MSQCSVFTGVHSITQTFMQSGALKLPSHIQLMPLKIGSETNFKF
jgi:hypothetical protein